MTVIVVTTAADTIADDGKTSLREAVAQAAGTSGHVDIVFDEATFLNPDTYVVTAIQLGESLTITGGDITIDGSLYYGGNGYGLKISGSTLSTNALTVEAGAKVTLRDLTIQGSSSNNIKAAYGADGHNGTDGTNGTGVPNGLPTLPPPGQGTSGTHATDGADAPNDAEDGRMAVGAIVNRGDLVLERVDIRNFKTEGGAGGLGGEGGRGGAGGNGEPGSWEEGPHQSGGNGGNGGNSGDGANGGNGGAAVAGIYNAGTLTLRDTAFAGMYATGGNGGEAGDGPWGGHGGGWGSSFYDTVAQGGNGGNGGDGGNGGNGGFAAGALYNVGTVTVEGVQSAVIASSLTGGLAGVKGEGGNAGVHGGSYASSWHFAQDGLDGAEGVDGKAGAGGGKGDFYGAVVETGASFIIDAAKTVISEADGTRDRTIYFSVRLLGKTASTNSVKWSIVPGDGITGADFEGGLPAGGTLTFTGSTSEYLFGYVIAADGKAEGLETFTIKLSNPVGGQLGWSQSVTVAIVDGDTEGNAPTGMTLSKNTTKENARANTLIGNLKGTDPDAGDKLAYSMVDSAGGRFKIVGNQIKVANGLLLDYEQARVHTVVVRATDLFGNTFDKAFAIKVTDVAVEKLVGDGNGNTLYGGRKADTLDGKLGNDTLKGNGGKDSFIFSTALDAGANVDHIVDFARGQDKIKLSHTVFAGLPKGGLAKAAFHLGTEAADGKDRILYDKGTGTLYFDKDGARPGGVDPVAFAILDNHAALTFRDFLIT